MAKFIILFFLITGGGVSYLTYTGIGQERIETLEKESVRSNSSRSSGSFGGSWGGSGSSYNSSSSSYGK
ncbi:MAG: Unknown protein [uncultured Sulfurovum sp.]|uniref:Uncharacterized protein n=1 Tax=uncultured Sulfurovum sp. TaxID=269237 RepID=A0A6S6THK5_9BACT|nr:MAG: Unknown protein [uncultured Sulfurovum sp.]